MNKKAEFVWSKLANIILVLVLLFVLLAVLYFLKENLDEIWRKIVEFLRFGG